MVRMVGPSLTTDYIPSVVHFGYTHRKPPWSLHRVDQMLSDPRIRFGLFLIKGPIIGNAKFKVTADNLKVGRFVADNLARFWRNSSLIALSAVEWGYSGSEVMYRFKSGLVYFDKCKRLMQRDTMPVTLRGDITGMNVRNVKSKLAGQVYIPLPRALWHVHGREFHPWFGSSRLKGAYEPWFEQYSDGGAKDARRLYYHKYLYSGDIIRYPKGRSSRTEGGQQTSNRAIAEDIAIQRRTGGITLIPNDVDSHGNPAWVIENGQAVIPSSDILLMIKDLRDETWEGMGIPPEIARAEGTGAFAGRRVPQQAFYSILQEILRCLISDVDEQIIRPLININFGGSEYEIKSEPLEPPVSQPIPSHVTEQGQGLFPTNQVNGQT